ncbi:Apulose-4-phosphate transketolase subunit A [subsurface metagenome]
MEKLSNKDIKELIEKSYNSRINILKMMKNGEGHIGGAYSGLDIITVVYNKILNHDPKNPKWKDRDRFILSAGHKCLALYATLADQKYFDEDVLWTYNTLNTKVQMHPDEKILPGVEFPTGSLGHGLPVANGIALSTKLDHKNFRVFVMLGDGECAEGSVWEAAMSAAHHKLDNLIMIIDRNGLQVNGRTKDIMDTSPFEEKFASFGWEVRTINGHDFSQIHQTLSDVPFSIGKPSCIIADTIKCKGLSFGEDKFNFHHWHCEPDDIDNAINIVKAAGERELEGIG